MNNANFAQRKFEEGFNCAESVLFGSVRDKNFDLPLILAASSGFGGGMGRKQKVCGAITGAVMAIGVLNSPYNDSAELDVEILTSSMEIKNRNYQLVHEFISHFEKEFGHVNCLELLDNCDLTTPEGSALFKSGKLKQQLCYKYVRYAADYVENLIKNDNAV
ncbi:C-GCAxxG-C-C family protein [Natronoflexus pectinivorans]|uniref:C_GCAxxG_C_C family probable redox protein n=1 Tax=Natronoflexus pectinivorans TaxID=682526 RepID=A0A4V2RWM4_9BACT|nr:C-GCAxxG-C-C family protein [Natronoflexus pectinivorans]TCO09160.1 C_GCAxxG_C_C family probable redox protein [Natronoflexus pectinivorans]